MAKTAFEDNKAVVFGWAGIAMGLLFSIEIARAFVILSVPVELVLLLGSVGLGCTLAVLLVLLGLLVFQLCRRRDSVAGDWIMWAGR